MRIGPLRERVTIQQESNVADDMGGSALTWVSVTSNPTVWARVEPLTGKEVGQAMQLQESVNYRVWLRYRTDLIAKMRIVWGSRVFNIRAVTSDEKRMFTQALCEEGVAT